jgi:hypothetical protein
MTDPSLEDYLDDLDNQPDQPDHFRIDDDEMAAWAMRKLRRLRKRQASNAAIAQTEAERITEWLRTVNKPLEDNAHYFEGLLTDYAIRQRFDDDRKTISLPAGKVSTRTVPPKWEVDAEPFLAWARVNAPTLIRVKEEADVKALKESVIPAFAQGDQHTAVDENGEVIPGVLIRTTDLPSATITVDLD